MLSLIGTGFVCVCVCVCVCMCVSVTSEFLLCLYYV